MLAYVEDDMEAFELLYHRHKDRILGFLLARLRDRSEAEDVFQAVFTKLHRKRHQYRPEIPFLPWLFTLARNTLIDHVRKRQVEGRRNRFFAGYSLLAYGVLVTLGPEVFVVSSLTWVVGALLGNLLGYAAGVQLRQVTAKG